MSDQQLHNEAMQQFIELANQMKNEGKDIQMISAALMSANCLYTTYVAAGNNGVLNPSGVEKVVDTFRSNLEFIQARKRQDLEAQKAQGTSEEE